MAVARDQRLLCAHLIDLAIRGLAHLHEGEAKSDACDAAIFAKSHVLKSAFALAFNGDEPLAQVIMLGAFDDVSRHI